MFRILSIDGGGIRGIIPAKVLSLLEEDLGMQGKPQRLNEYFDLICGTSTGGIIAIGIALGMPATEILALYRDNATKIFPKANTISKFFRGINNKPLYERGILEKLLMESYAKYAGETPARLGHCKTRVCIPCYDAHRGMMHVFKTSHCENLIRDYQIPAHCVALSTAAAPVYFDSYDFEYQRKRGSEKITYCSQIDGGIMANNPTFIGYTEAINALNVKSEDLAILSIGTGNNLFKDKPQTMGAKYWFYTKSHTFAFYDLISSAQSDYTDNLMKLYQKGIGNDGQPKFLYDRIQHSFESSNVISMDSTNEKTLAELERIGQNLYSDSADVLINKYCNNTKEKFTPFNSL